MRHARRFAFPALAGVVLAGCIRHDLARTNVVAAKPEPKKDTARWKSWFWNTYFYPVARAVIPAAGEATNVDAAGEVPTGSFFVKRDIRGLTPEAIERGPCVDLDVPGPVRVTTLKPHRTKPGFFGKDARGRRYLFKFDQAAWPEMNTGAEAVATRLLWAIGYHVPANRIWTVRGCDRPEFEGRRVLASEFIQGDVLGPWKFRDAYRRREMRALRVVAAWIHNTDHQDHNTLTVWRDGQAYYYLLDFDNALGADSYGEKKPWAGWRHRWDVEEQFLALGSLGLTLLRRRPYDPPAPVVSPAVGRFDSRVDPRFYKTDFPNYAFASMTVADGVWMARRLAQFTEPQVRAAVRAGRYSKQADEDYLVKTLLERRDRICAFYGVEKDGV